MASTTRTALPVPQVPIPESSRPLFAAINAFVYEYMSNYDNSHDYQHILRVLSNTNRILQAELKTNPSATFDTTALFLAALLHDVGDHKYAKPGEDIENQISNVLVEKGAAKEVAEKVQTIVKHVSYTHEVANSTAVQTVLAKYPELCIVQDADRLDAIGAIGIARCFSFGAAKMPDQPMDRAVGHFGEKLYKLKDMMKTRSGKEMSERRHETMVQFEKEWDVEASLSFQMP
jgi:uncharacterized protein